MHKYACFWPGGPAVFWPPGGALSPKFPQIGGFPLTLPENCMILKNSGGPGPQDPSRSASEPPPNQKVHLSFSQNQQSGKGCTMSKKEPNPCGVDAGARGARPFSLSGPMANVLWKIVQFIIAKNVPKMGLLFKKNSWIWSWTLSIQWAHCEQNCANVDTGGSRLIRTWIIRLQGKFKVQIGPRNHTAISHVLSCPLNWNSQGFLLGFVCSDSAGPTWNGLLCPATGI